MPFCAPSRRRSAHFYVFRNKPVLMACSGTHALMDRQRKLQIIDKEILKLEAELQSSWLFGPSESERKSKTFITSSLIPARKLIHNFMKMNCDHISQYINVKKFVPEGVVNDDNRCAPDRIFVLNIQGSYAFIFYYASCNPTQWYCGNLGIDDGRFTTGFSNKQPEVTDPVELAAALIVAVKFFSEKEKVIGILKYRLTSFKDW